MNGQTENNDNCWLKPMLTKRSPDALRVLMDLIEAGLRKGECSANDIRDIQLEQPNIIGGVFKILTKFGFEHTDMRVKTVTKKKHARRVDIWKMTEPNKAQEVILHLRNVLLGSNNRQMYLL